MWNVYYYYYLTWPAVKCGASRSEMGKCVQIDGGLAIPLTSRTRPFMINFYLFATATLESLRYSIASSQRLSFKYKLLRSICGFTYYILLQYKTFEQNDYLMLAKGTICF